MNESFELTLEQEFRQRKFADRVKTMSEEQVRQLAIELYGQMMLKENYYKELIGRDWGIRSGMRRSPRRGDPN